MPAPAETDPFFNLLTDALRAGPASPQWRDAVAHLREQGAAEADEYRLLIDARESLESGKEYGSVRAGPGFTNKLMGQLGEQESQRRGLPWTTLIAIVCTIAVIGSLIYVAYRASSSHPEVDQQAIDQLAADSRTFFNEISSATFNGSIPEGWKPIGSLPLDFTSALRPANQPAANGESGGGIYLAAPIPPEKNFTLEVKVTVSKPADGWTIEAFVAGGSNFSADRGTSPDELDWLVRGKQQQVVVNGHVNNVGAAPTATFPIRLTIGREVAIVETGQRGSAQGNVTFHQIWSGAHHLPS